MLAWHLAKATGHPSSLQLLQPSPGCSLPWLSLHGSAAGQRLGRNCSGTLCGGILQSSKDGALHPTVLLTTLTNPFLQRRLQEFRVETTPQAT